jgi:hypothetical protein
MQDISKKQLRFFGFYYFWMIFLVACTVLDFYMDTVSGFTFGYMGAFIYFAVRLQDVRAEAATWNWGDEDDN